MSNENKNNVIQWANFVVALVGFIGKVVIEIISTLPTKKGA